MDCTNANNILVVILQYHFAQCYHGGKVGTQNLLFVTTSYNPTITFKIQILIDTCTIWAPRLLTRFYQNTVALNKDIRNKCRGEYIPPCLPCIFHRSRWHLWWNGIVFYLWNKPSLQKVSKRSEAPGDAKLTLAPEAVQQKPFRFSRTKSSSCCSHISKTQLQKTQHLQPLLLSMWTLLCPQLAVLCFDRRRRNIYSPLQACTPLPGLEIYEVISRLRGIMASSTVVPKSYVPSHPSGVAVASSLFPVLWDMSEKTTAWKSSELLPVWSPQILLAELHNYAVILQTQLVLPGKLLAAAPERNKSHCF